MTSFTRICLIVASTLAAILGFFGDLGNFVDKARKGLSRIGILADHDGVPLAGGSYLIASWLLYPLFLAPLAAIVLGVALAIHGRASAARSRQSATQSRQTALESDTARDNIATAYNETCAAIGRIVNRIYNPADPNEEPRPRVNFARILCRFDVEPDGTTRATLDYEVTATGGAAHFWNVKLVTDQYAAPLRTLADIAFKTESLDAGKQIQEVQIDNSGFERRVALFFLPEIQPGETRRFRVTYAWKDWFAELRERGMSDWTWSYRAAEAANMAEATFVFAFARGWGTITCENLLGNRPGATLREEIGRDGISWTYRDPAAPVGKSGWRLRFSRSR